MSSRERERQRLREKRLAAEAAERRRHRRAALFAASLAALSATLAVISGLVPDQPAPVRISAELSSTGTMELNFKKPLGETTSPACGCYREDPPGGWQGIVMPARTILFGRTDDGEPTQYDIFSPGPAQWMHLPNSRGFRSRVGGALLRSSVTPTVEAIQAAMRSSKWIGREAHDVLSITTPGSLSAASLGREPVAALGVPARSPTYIGYSATHRGRDATLRIRSAFRSSDMTDSDDTNSIPMLDVLGPRVLLWAPAHPELSFTEAVWYEPPPPYEPGGFSAVGGGRFHVRFQETPPRSALPKGFTLYTVALIEKGAFAVRIVPRPGAGDAWTTVDDIPSDAGEMEVTVPRAASQAKALVPVFRRADARPKAPVNDIPFMSDSETVAKRTFDMSFDERYTLGMQDFELPPTPPEDGINIFGEIESLRLSDAKGSFVIGSQPREINARTPIELRRFISRRDPKNRLLVPVQVDPSSARFEFQGEAETRFQGEPVATARPWIARVLGPDIVTMICAVAALLFVGITGRQVRSAPA